MKTESMVGLVVLGLAAAVGIIAVVAQKAQGGGGGGGGGDAVTLYASVYDADTNQPIPGALVRYGNFSGQTNSAGALIISGIPLNVSLARSIQAAGYITQTLGNITFTHAGDVYGSYGLAHS